MKPIFFAVLICWEVSSIKRVLETSNLLVELPSPFSEELLHYNIKDVTLNKDIETGIYDMNGEIWVEEFKEDGSPITIRIYSEEALARKIDNSFGLYPTVFSNSCEKTSHAV